jgi:hypothetical protein
MQKDSSTFAVGFQLIRFNRLCHQTEDRALLSSSVFRQTASVEAEIDCKLQSNSS